MNKKIKIYIIYCALCVIVSTILFFVFNTTNELSVKVGFGFLLFAEIDGFLVLIIAEYKHGKLLNKISRQVFLVITEFYSVMVFITSLMYLLYFRGHISIFLIFILTVTIAAVTAFLMVKISSEYEAERKVIDSKAISKSFLNELEIISDISDKKDEIGKIMLEIAQTDNDVLLKIALKLNELVFKLGNIVRKSNMDVEEFNETVEKIMVLIRNNKDIN